MGDRILPWITGIHELLVLELMELDCTNIGSQKDGWTVPRVILLWEWDNYDCKKHIFHRYLDMLACGEPSSSQQHAWWVLKPHSSLLTSMLKHWQANTTRSTTKLWCSTSQSKPRCIKHRQKKGDSYHVILTEYQTAHHLPPPML